MNRGAPTVDQLIQDTNLRQKAGILRSSDQRPKLSVRVPIALDVARSASDPLVIIQPFNGFYVESTTDSSTSVKMGLGSVDKYNTDNYSTLKENDAAFSPEEIRGCTLFWDAQAGKEMTIVFYVGVEFRPGSLLSVITGGVTINEGSALTQAGLGAAGNASSVACSTSIAQLLASDSSRKVAKLFNPGTDLWVGNAAVTAGVGLYWPSNTWLTVRNTAAIYAIAAAGTSTVTGVVES